MFSDDQLTQVHAGAATSLPVVLGGPDSVGGPVSGVSGSLMRKFNIHKQYSLLKVYNSSSYTSVIKTFP